MPGSFNIDRRRELLKQTLATLPRTVGVLAVNFFKDRFRAGGWYDSGFVPWKPRSPKSRRNSGRALLVDSGRLRRSIRISKLGTDSVTIGTDVPYARIHNEGFHGTVTVKAHQRSRFEKKKVGTGKLTARGTERMKTVQTLSGTTQVRQHSRRVNMPQRRFMGESQYLTRIVGRKIQTEVMKALQS